MLQIKKFSVLKCLLATNTHLCDGESYRAFHAIHFVFFFYTITFISSSYLALLCILMISSFSHPLTRSLTMFLNDWLTHLFIQLFSTLNFSSLLFSHLRAREKMKNNECWLRLAFLMRVKFIMLRIKLKID